MNRSTEHWCITATSNKVGENVLPNLAHVNIADLDFLKSHASVIHKEPYSLHIKAAHAEYRLL